MSLSEQIMLMRQELDSAEKEIKSLEGGRKASAARARKSLQSLKNSSHGLRKSIVEHTKSLPVKSRKKVEEINVQDARMSQVETEPEPIEDLPKADASKKKAKPKRIPKKVLKE